MENVKNLAQHTTPAKPDTGAKRRILDHLKLNGPTSAQMIATELQVTPMAIRQHLYVLQDEGMVETTSSPHATGRGRPTKLWSLSLAAQTVFPDAHQDLAVELLKSVEGIFGPDGLAHVIDRHSASQFKTYTTALAGADTVEARLNRLVEIRSKEGYMAELQRDGADYLFVENNCPVCSAAKTCTRLCANELDVFKKLLGRNVQINREEHITAGARRCLYRVRANR